MTQFTKGISLAAAAALMTATGGCATMMGDDAAMASDQNVPMVGGAPMYPTKNIIENAVNSQDHTTLVAAVKAAGLVDTLSGPGPFTVFAPTDAAFAKLPAGTVDTLVMPANKAMLTSILTYHVVPGKLSAADIAAQAARNGGTLNLRTVAGGMIALSRAGNGWRIVDAKGGTSMITIADVNQSNGVIHVVDTVLMP
ncbi:fasciclin domain-containing protein [Sphingomonas sp. AX6]|uniref:fasciclin domain-containing protein n=1 Tax=Sphingomonas sp. AX6 TaxID=2653171 RepID=UPI0012EFD2ED|nr:fasciclin domain-containing protein [Sphingomonas sp. AX6]VXC66168.1 Putative surface protein with fasciclin (FAS1) repeats [Sphingomonas sp. AX6]